jgi:hypothetical protein
MRALLEFIIHPSHIPYIEVSAALWIAKALPHPLQIAVGWPLAGCLAICLFVRSSSSSSGSRQWPVARIAGVGQRAKKGKRAAGVRSGLKEGARVLFGSFKLNPCPQDWICHPSHLPLPFLIGAQLCPSSRAPGHDTSRESHEAAWHCPTSKAAFACVIKPSASGCYQPLHCSTPSSRVTPPGSACWPVVPLGHAAVPAN